MRPVTRHAVLIAVALGVLFGAPGVAYAKSVSTPGFTYISQRNCGWNQATLSDVGGRPRLDSVGTMDWWGNNAACGDQSYQAQPWAIALRQNLMFWNGSLVPARWMICDTSAPWVQNAGWAHQVTTGFGWGAPPCGSNFYRSFGETMTWDGGWKSDTAILGSDWVIAQ